MLANIALAFVVVVFGIYAAMLIFGMIQLFPFGLIGLIFLGMFGLLFGIVTLQRLTNREDRHYVENVKE